MSEVTFLTGLVSWMSSNVASAGKAYPMEVPQGVSGWSYYVVSNVPTIGHSGAQNFYTARIQVDLQYAENGSNSAYKATKTIADAMRAALDGYKGAMGSAQVEFCKTETTDDWAPTAESPTVRFDIVLNYKV